MHRQFETHTGFAGNLRQPKKRRFGQLALLLCSAAICATAVPAHASPIPLWPQPTDDAPTAENFSLFLNIFDRDDGSSVRRMDVNDLQYYANQARCECNEQLQVEARLSQYMGTGAQLRMFIGPKCDIAETTTNSINQPCAVFHSGTTSDYLTGVFAPFDLIWLTGGIDRSLGDSQDPAVAVSSGSCDIQNTGGVYLCAPFGSDGMDGCQADDFIVSGDKIDNITDDSMATGLTADFQPPTSFPPAFETSVGDGSIVVSWDLDMPVDIRGYRVLCADAETGAPGVEGLISNPAGRRFDVNINTDTLYFTRDNLCGGASTGVCGDGVVDAGEECDGQEGCLEDCTTPECGDGVIEGTEECDDGNTVDEDACLATCLPATCGDGVVAAFEACDPLDDNTCFDNCSLSETCGDGVVDEGEECDDGNTDDTDTCLTSCLNAFCGDAIVQDGEACDSSPNCTDTCEVGEDTCNNMEMDEDEDGIDCGGPCTPCEDACNNGIKDNGEDGVDCGGTCTNTCDGIRSLDWSYVCTEAITATASSARIDGLENNRAYNLMVVAYDTAGNPRVSEILTATPQATSDFWEQCEADGNLCGDGGFCSVAGDNGPSGLALVGLTIAMLGRRRRRCA